MKWMVDRIEGGFALCEDEQGRTFSFPLAELPPDLHEGAVLRWQEECFLLDAEEEENRRARALDLLRRLRTKRDPE